MYCFLFLDFVNGVAMNILLCLSWCTCAHISIGYIPRNKLGCMLCFSRRCQTVFQSGLINLHSNLSLYPCQHSLLLMLNFSHSGEWVMVSLYDLFFISLINNQVDHLFICLLIIWLSLWILSPVFKFLAQFSFWLFAFFLLIWKN